MSEPTTVLVVGLGASGSAVAIALLQRGLKVRIVDSHDGATQRRHAAALGHSERMEILLGHELADHALLEGITAVVTSPGVPEDAAILRAAEHEQIAVLSEPEFAYRVGGSRTRLVAVTGTNGKTTTTEVIAACLDAPSAGNIGRPLTTLLTDVPVPRLAVVELSSFQLRFAGTLRPQVAVLLNVAPDHLDWHGSLKAYRAAKARIWEHQTDDDWVVANHDDAGARETVEEFVPPGNVAWFRSAPPQDGEVGIDDGWIVQRVRANAPEGLVKIDEMALKGPHNVANACAAAAAALLAGAQPHQLLTTLRNFAPGPHRMELVAEIDRVAWVNDSKATNPHAAAAALAAYPSVVWIAGGLNKDLSFDSLQPLLAGRVRVALTIGTSGPEIAELVRACGVEAVEAGTLEAAVAQAVSYAQPGDTVLLSPACASMDQFEDYADRGMAFRELVRAVADQRERGA